MFSCSSYFRQHKSTTDNQKVNKQKFEKVISHRCSFTWAILHHQLGHLEYICTHHYFLQAGFLCERTVMGHICTTKMTWGSVEYPGARVNIVVWGQTRESCTNDFSCKISFISVELITTKFCTCHDSWAVMACAKFCSDLMDRNWITAKGWFEVCVKNHR